MFAKFFKPRWLHSKAAVRIRAIHRLSPDNTEHLEVLARLARQDQSPEVRLAAVTRIDTPALLSDIVSHESDPDVRRKAADRICRIILDPAYPLNQQQECLKHLQEDNMLAHIVLNSKQADLQLQALSRIDDQHCLLTLTVNGSTTLIRQTAAAKLELSELLEQAEKAIKGRDKTVFRIIRDKQQALNETARIAEQANLRQAELLDSLTHLSNTEYFALFRAKLEALQQQWHQLANEAEPQQEISDQYQTLISACQKVVDAEQQRITAKQTELEQQQRIKQQQDILLVQLSECQQRCEQLLSCSSFTKQDLLAEQEGWQKLLHSEQLIPTGKRFEDLNKRFEHQLNSGLAWLENYPQLVALTEHEEQHSQSPKQQIQALNKLVQLIDWPAAIAQPEALSALLRHRDCLQQQHKELNQQRQNNTNDLKSILDELEKQIESGNTRQAIRLEQKIDEQVTGLNGNTPKPLQQRYKALHARLAELKDWQGYAVVPTKEELCEQMAALAGSEMDPALLAKKIHRLQQQWKSLDASDPFHSHSLWQRFKSASDQAYGPCETYFREQKQQRLHNLEQRQELVKELETFMAEQEWSEVNWTEIEQLSRNVKQQWKSHAPVDRTPGRQAQTRFNALLKQLDGKIKGHREVVAEAKQLLLEQARALISSDNFEAAASEIKNLQKQWKQAGNTFHQTERSLWPEFRSACNTVFEQLNQQKQGQSQQAEQDEEPLQQLLDSHWYQALQHRISLCDQLENMLLDGTLDQLALDELQNAWSQGADAGKEFAPLIGKRFELLLSLVADRLEMDELLEQTEAELRQLCIRLEILLGHDSPEQDQALRMEYQMDRLQKALEQRHQLTSPCELKLLELEWQCQPFTLQHEALQIRFYSHLEQAR